MTTLASHLRCTMKSHTERGKGGGREREGGGEIGREKGEKGQGGREGREGRKGRKGGKEGREGREGGREGRWKKRVNHTPNKLTHTQTQAQTSTILV